MNARALVTLVAAAAAGSGAGLADDARAAAPGKAAGKPAPKAAPPSAAEVAAFGSAYRDWLDAARTSMLSVDAARRAALARGFRVLDLDAPPEAWPLLSPGDGVFVAIDGRTAVVARAGARPPSHGFRIVAAHVDAPALRIDPRPRAGKMPATDGAALTARAHGGLKPYQWASRPLMIVGLVAPVHGAPVRVRLGPGDDYAFLLEPREPDVAPPEARAPKAPGDKPVVYRLVGATSAAPGDERGGSAARLEAALLERHGLTPRDLEAAELYAVPAEAPRDAGLDRAYVLGPGQDDRACAYAALRAVLDLDAPPPLTAVAVLVDREEIGSTGRSGMRSEMFELAMAALLHALGHPSDTAALRDAFRRTSALSTDVKAGMDPIFPEVHDAKNAPVVGRGPTIVKATGHLGKLGASDASAELGAWLRRVAAAAGVPTQDSESGKVDEGGGGTVSRFLAERGMDVIDAGVPILSMHAPFELAAKSDVFNLARLARAFYAAPPRP